MGPDVVELLDRQHARLQEKDGREFVHELKRFHDFITAGPDGVTGALSELRAEAAAAEATFNDHDRALVPELVELKRELVARAPEADDSGIARPHNVGAPPLQWIFSFANFDQVAGNGRTRDFIWDIPYLIRYITRVMALEPGDIVMTGTPQGVGPVEVGQTISAEIEGLGRLENHVIAEPAT